MTSGGGSQESEAISFPNSRRSSRSSGSLKGSPSGVDTPPMNASESGHTSAPAAAQKTRRRGSILKLPTENSGELRAAALLRSVSIEDHRPLAPGFFRTTSQDNMKSSDENLSRHTFSSAGTGTWGRSWSSLLSNTLSTTSDTLFNSFGKKSFATSVAKSLKKSFTKLDHRGSAKGARTSTTSRQQRDEMFRIVLPNGGHLSGLSSTSFGTSARVKVSGMVYLWCTVCHHTASYHTTYDNTHDTSYHHT